MMPTIAETRLEDVKVTKIIEHTVSWHLWLEGEATKVRAHLSRIGRTGRDAFDCPFTKGMQCKVFMTAGQRVYIVTADDEWIARVTQMEWK